MLGFLLEKQRGSLKDLVCQWVYLIFFGLLFLLIAMFGFQVYSLNKFYVVIMPIIRNAYPLISGILLAQLLKPFFDQLYRFKKPAVIAEKVIIFFAIGALIPTFFNSDLFGFSGGYSLIFGCYSYLLGIALAKFIQLKKISLKPFKLIWLTGLSWLVSVVLNGLMPYISYAASISLRTASRFVAPSSFFNLLTAVFLWLSIWILFKKYFQKFSTIQNSRLLYQILGTLMIATGYPLCSTILSINSTWNPQQLGKIKLLLALIEAIILPIIIMLINLGLDHLFKKINSVFSLSQKLRIITAFLKNYQQVPYKLFEFLKVHRRSLLVFGWFFIIAAASMLVMNTSWKISPSTALTTNIFVYTLFIRFPIIILNVLIIGALFMILRFILADLYWLPLILVALFYLIFSLISRQKLTIRNEPLLPADLSMIKDAGSLLGMVDGTIVILIIGLIIILLTGAILLDIFRPVKRRSWKKRGIWLLISLAGLSTTFFLNHKNSPVQLISSLIGNQPTFYNQPVGSQINGAVLQFLNNVDVKIMDQPAGYSQATMQKIARKYQKAAAKINQTRKNDPSKQTIIFTLSESFSDPERVPQMTINKDPMPYLRSLKLKTTSGLMLSSGYGGGTANMEYMTLTGFSMSNFSQTLPTPYTQIVSSLKYNNSFNQIFKYSAAIHPYLGVYYNRVQVYQKFGFKRFYYLGSKYQIAYQKKIDRSPYLSDQTAYENAIDQVKRKSGGQFINLITMQNHYPFNKNFYNSVGFKVSGRAVPSDTDQASAEDFATGVSYTD
jgi:phosphoglycerol transferase MdoB-like AlkP superfamily enzyme